MEHSDWIALLGVLATVLIPFAGVIVAMRIKISSLTSDVEQLKKDAEGYRAIPERLARLEEQGKNTMTALNRIEAKLDRTGP